MTNKQKGFLVPLLAVIVVLVAGGAYLYSKDSSETLQQETDVQTSSPAQADSSVKPTASETSANTSGSSKPTITNVSGSSIVGVTMPNYYVWAYGVSERCVSRDTMAVYGASQANAQGKYSITIPNVAATGRVNIVVFASPDTSFTRTPGADFCLPTTNVSAPVSFTITR